MNPSARQQFLSDYAKIRHAEGRGSDDSSYYLALPDRDLSGKSTQQWNIRARSFRHFESTFLAKAESRYSRKLDILDLGAGNGWMSYRLSQRQHHVVALDIFCDQRDGLGAVVHYPRQFAAVAAEFDSLPFQSETFDLAVFNSSFHYSSDYVRTLTELRRCLRPTGMFVIMDTPLYRHREHGEMMRAERQGNFEKLYGFRSEALQSIEYLDSQALRDLSQKLNIEWSMTQPWYGLQWAMRPWKAKLSGTRPPSRFVVLSGKFTR